MLPVLSTFGPNAVGLTDCGVVVLCHERHCQSNGVNVSCVIILIHERPASAWRCALSSVCDRGRFANCVRCVGGIDV